MFSVPTKLFEGHSVGFVASRLWVVECQFPEEPRSSSLPVATLGPTGVRLPNLCAVNTHHTIMASFGKRVVNLFKNMYSANTVKCVAMKKVSRVYTGDAGHPNGLTQAPLEKCKFRFSKSGNFHQNLHMLLSVGQQ